MVEQLSAAAAARADHPGPIAEMLEPNLKDGAGGLRDLQALVWAGIAVGGGREGEPDGIGALLSGGFLQPNDPAVLERRGRSCSTLRVELHRTAGGSGDVLLLQEQDAVAAALGAADADALIADLAVATRAVTWISSDVWRRLGDAARGPLGRIARRDRPVATASCCVMVR